MSREYDISLVETPKKIGGVDYILREADETTATKWRNSVIACSRYSKGQMNSIRGLGETQALLVSMCLFNGDDKTVSLETIRSWPSRVVKALFEEAKEISDLEKEDTLEELKEQRTEIEERITNMEENAVKNDSTDTVDGSS